MSRGSVKNKRRTRLYKDTILTADQKEVLKVINEFIRHLA